MKISAQLFRRNTTSGNYLPEIDGLRFLAIALVLLFHLYGNFRAVTIQDMPSTHGEIPLMHQFLRDGDKGVPLFFSLSGFILAYPFLLHICQNAAPISLKRFFLRRLTRLEPPYIITLTILLLAKLAMDLNSWSTLGPSYVASLFYVHNIVLGMPLIAVVSWSLEIEIQFYLLVPLLVQIFYLSPKIRRTILILLLVGFPLMRNWFALPVITLYDYFEYFIGGMLVADYFINRKESEIRFLESAIIGYCGFPIFVLLLMFDHNTDLVNRMLFPLLIVLFYLIVLSNSVWKRVFGWQPIALIGGMCYSIYLWHFAVISFCSKVIPTSVGNSEYWTSFGVYAFLLLIPILAISAIFYLLIEKPCMNPNWPEKLKAAVTNFQINWKEKRF